MDKRYVKFQSWLTNVLDEEFPDTVLAINFNLYEDEDSFWSIELVGTGSFDENDDDWACDEVYTTRDDDELFSISFEGSFEEVLEIFSSYIIQYLESGKLANKLKCYKAVAIGFVDGDLKILYKKN